MNVSGIVMNVNESSCNSKDTNSSNIQEVRSNEFSSILEKSEKNLISSNDTLLNDKINDNEIILNQYLANDINFLLSDK